MKTLKNNNIKFSNKKAILTVLVLMISNFFFAQTSFDKFDGQEDVTSIIVNQKMFELMSKVKVDATDKETQQYLNLIKKLNTLKVFTTTNDRVEADMKSSVDKYTKSSGLEELMRVNDNGKSVKILIKSGSKDAQVKELLMFIEGSKGDETVLLSLTGDFNLNEISALTDKMNLPGGDDLKKASKK